MFVTTVVSGLVAITVPYTVTRRPFLRDTLFYFIAANWVCYGGPLECFNDNLALTLLWFDALIHMLLTMLMR